MHLRVSRFSNFLGKAPHPRRIGPPSARMSGALPPPVPLSDGLDIRPCKILDPPLFVLDNCGYTDNRHSIEHGYILWRRICWHTVGGSLRHSVFILAFASSNSCHTVQVADDWPRPTNDSYANSVELLSCAIPIDSFDS